MELFLIPKEPYKKTYGGPSAVSPQK